MSDDVLNVIERRITDLECESGKIRNQERKQHLLVVIKDLKQVSDALHHCYAECEDRGKENNAKMLTIATLIKDLENRDMDAKRMEDRIHSNETRIDELNQDVEHWKKEFRRLEALHTEKKRPPTYRETFGDDNSKMDGTWPDEEIGEYTGGNNDT